MNTSLLKVINYITAQYGADILNDSRRVNALLADLAKDDPRPAKRALIAALEAGFHQALRNAGEAGRGAALADLARRLHQDEGYDLTLCADTLELLAAALCGERQPEPETAPHCAACGRELQKDWKACPYCGVAYGTSDKEKSRQKPVVSTVLLGAHEAVNHFERGKNFLAKGERINAIAAFTEAIKLNSNDAEAYFYRGRAKRNSEEAIVDFTAAINLNPNHADAYYYRGLAYYGQINIYSNSKRKYEEAITDFTAAINLNPNYAAAYHHRGLAYYFTDRTHFAIRDLETALRLDPHLISLAIDLHDIRGW
jgi:tetratricopeptide (TPR) repeat protein